MFARFELMDPTHDVETDHPVGTKMLEQMI